MREVGPAPAAQAAVAAHLVRHSALAFAQRGLAALVGAQDVEPALALADALRVEEHEGAILGLETTESRALGALHHGIHQHPQGFGR